MGLNVKSLYKDNSKNTNNSAKKVGLNVKSLRDQVFELKLSDNKTISNISYGAKVAIENNTLDSYTPKNEEEKKSLETYKKYTGYGKTFDTVKSQYEKDKYGKGNIDLTNRPVLINEDKTMSTVDSITVGIDNKQVVLPTIVKDHNGNAKRLKTTDEAVAHYRNTGEYLGKFDTIEEADEYAQSLHIDQDLYYSTLNAGQGDTIKKDNFGAWLGKQAMAGVGQFNKGIAATLDFILPTEFLGKYDVISKLNDYYDGLNTGYATEAQKSSASRGKGWKTAGDIVSGTVAALPNAILAYMSAGVSLGTTGATTIASGASATTGTTVSALKQVVKTTMKNPSYWTSVMRTLGTDYEEAKERGANDFVAATTAIITTALNAGIEVGGGIEQLPKNLKQGGVNAVYNWAKSSLEEGGEEVLQKITTNAIAKIMYDHDVPVYSTKDENAVINPISLAKDFGMGVAVGGVSGGILSTVATGVNTAQYVKTGKFYNQPEIVNAIIDTGLESPKDSTAYKLAEKAQRKLNKKGKLSDYEIGKLYYANVEQIDIEERSANTEAKTSTNENTDTATDTSVDVATSSEQTNTVSTVTENTTAETSAPVVTEKRNTFTDELDEIASTEMPSVGVGETFVDKGSNNIIKVIGRNESVTEIEITRPNGTKETKLLPNKTADSMVVDDKYIKVETSAPNNQNNANLVTTEVETAVNNAATTPSVNVGDVYEADGKTYTITGRENGRTTYTVTDKNGNVTTREISNVVADINFTKEEEYRKVQGGQPVTSINDKRMHDTDKSHTVAYTNDNEKIDLLLKIESIDDIIASNELDGKINPDYPQELQPRDRKRVSSQTQIMQMAKNLNPARLAESTSVSEGAPIVGPDNVVESGNGRTLAIKLAYQLGTAEEYRNYIISKANEYGIDVSNLPEKPVLVRERLTEVNRIEFTRKANESSISSLSATEQARVDAENLTQDVLNLLVANDDGEINSPDNKSFISAVINKVFNNEDLNNVVGAEGRLSQRGKERITNAIFYKAYGDDSLSARLSESLDNDMKNATRVLLNIAPRVASIKNSIKQGDLYDFDFSEDIASAVRLFEKCRNEKMTIERYAAQETLFEKEPVRILECAYIFETKNRGAKQATDFYNILLDVVIAQGNPDQTRLDIVEPIQTKEEIFDEAIKQYNTGVEPKNTIAIPENLPGPESENWGENDGRGKHESLGGNTARSETSGTTDGIQRDNGPTEESGTIADDEQLRQTKESVDGKSEVSASAKPKEETPSEIATEETPQSDVALTDKCTLTATKRTDGDKKNIWVVSLNEKIPKDKFNELRKIVKPYGGNWSNFTKTLDLKPIPGFMFYSEPSADAIKVFNDFFTSDELSNSESKSNLDNNLANKNEEALNSQPESSTMEEKAETETPVVAENATTTTEEKNEDVSKPEKAVSKDKGTNTIAKFVSSKLKNGKNISSMELQKVANVAFGGTMADNAYSIKDVYDAMELGVNQHILSLEEVSADKMLELLELLPTQTKRTEEMVKFQQFSTPPSIAYLANYTANINANDIMLEPSAGIGGIAVFAKRDGAKVYVNELDNRRLDVLKKMPFDGFFNEDAEQINNILGGELEPTVIVMNPPFSSSSERNIQNTKIGAKHIEQALKILAPNGRLVAIVGNGMADGTPAFRNWWKDIKSQYNVRANIGINGKNYNKYGTNFDIQMLVIDKNGPTTTETVTGYVDTLQELQDKLGGIRDERPTIDYSANEQRTPATTRKETVTTGKRGSVGNSTVPDASSRTDKGKSGDTTRTSGKSNTQDIQPTDAERGKPASVTTESTDVVVDENGRVGNRESDRLIGEENTTRTDNGDSGQSDIQTRRTEPRKRVKKKELTDSIFEQYQTQPLAVKNAKPHPAKVSESAAMSAIEPPVITYKPNIPQDIIDNGVVSDVQLEAISYAGQSHSQTLPNGTTRGFFLGDGTGIGKGRTIAGMMLDNYNQGRKKAVWVTLNASLVNDAKRDVKALFGDSDLVTQFVGGNKADSILNTDEAIMVISYSALSKGFDNKDSNFEKIVKWLGKDFDGLIVFDEAHKMGNATSTKGTRGIKKASQTGIAGIALQEALPKAKIVYSSATGATEVENLRYAERLGLWGEGTPFIKGDDFVSKVKAGGLAAMELIARDMKAMGVYLSRNISYDDVQYDKITHKLTAPQTKIYDELARSWQIVLQNINKALETTNQDKDGHARGRALGAFWSSQQRFFNQILTSMQVPSVISDIEKQLADGKSCVIQLVSTNEAAQNQEFERLKSEDLELDEFDLTPKQVLMSLVENSFPVQQFEEYVDDNGNKRSKPIIDSKGNPVLNREAVEQRKALLTKLGSIKVPSSPIDMIINHFGTDLVAENTGRARRVIQKDGKPFEEKIGSKKDADVDAFQNGNKRIIIFSKAGGTGKSYHADRSAKNQQQRVHYLLEAGWQADNAVQGFGRSHRSNQAVAPIFKLVTTNLKGQMRFISTIAKRLDQLGAMTKGQRQAGGQGMFSASDNLENSFAADVLAGFYKDLVSNRVDGIDDGLAILEKLGLKNKILNEYNQIIPNAPELREVNKFLNRILSLESAEQNTVFEGYSERLQDATEKAMQAGTLDKGLENYKAEKITLNEVQDIREDEVSGAKTKYYNLTSEHKIKPVKFEDIPTESKSFVGFYKNKNTGNVRAVMHTSSSTDKNGNVTQNFKLIGQIRPEYIPQHRLYGNWVEIKADEAEKVWNEELSKLPEFRKENLHLISGVVLPVWDKLPTENVRIYRVLTSDGEMLIGRVVSEDMIDETLRRLGSSRKKEKIATKDLIEGIKNGGKVYLENDWMLTNRKVSGENRIELLGPSYEHHDMLMEKGVFAERIAYRTRYFIPADTNTEKIIDDVLKLSPVMRVENESASGGVHYSKRSVESTSEEENRWTTERVESEKTSKKGKDNLVSTAYIVNAIREKFGIPVATGKVTSYEAAAQYNERAETIRTRIANNLPDISHELGHHLDKQYGLSYFESVDELQKVVPQEFLDQYPEREWKAESVSWFMEKYLQNFQSANGLCPDFYLDFVSALSKEDLKAVNEIANAVNEYMSSDFSERVRASIVRGNVKEKTSLSEKAKKEHADWIDGFASIQDTIDYVEKVTGASLSGGQNAYKLAINQLNASTIANFNISHGFRDFYGNIVEGAKSFMECIANVKRKNLETLDEYLVLKHSLEWIVPKSKDTSVKRVFADATLEVIELIEKRIAEIEEDHPEMKDAAENLYEYQRNILKYIVMPAGGITEDTFNSLNEKYPCYVPFYRAIGKDGTKAKGTFANQTSPIKRAKGSGELIISPLESIINNTHKMTKFALRNQTMQVLANYADTVDGFGKFMEKVPPDMMPHVTDITRLKEKFEDALQQVVNSGEEYFAVSDLFDELFGNSVTDFTPIRNTNKKIVTVLNNGEFSYYQVHDDDLYSAIAEFTPTQLEGVIAWSQKLLQPMKLLITQNNPVFAGTNAIRDIGTAYKHSPINNPLLFAVKYASALKQVITKGDMYKQWQAMGGGHNSEVSANFDEIKKQLKMMSAKDMGKARRLVYSIFLHPIYTTAAFNDYIESVPRLMEFMRTLEAGGDLQEAIYNADDITTNFKRSGRSMRAKQTNAVIMFNNAALQGLDKTYRTLTSKDKSARTKTLIKWALSALLIAALETLWNKENDEEGYENLSSYKKNNFYNFSIGDGMFISLPKPRETALLDSFTERTIEYVFGNDEAFYDFGSYVAQQLLPPMLPKTLNPIDAVHDVLGSTVIGGIADVGFNKNFMDVPIEGKYDEYLPSNERYNENTSWLAYELGQTKLARMIDMSPKKIDHLISSYTGIIGQGNKALFPMNKENRDATIGLRNKFITDSNYSTDLLNKAYDNRDKAKLNWQYDDNINNAIEYEKNAVITSYISGMNKAIKTLPDDEQREGRKYLLKTLNNWNYDTTLQQENMLSRLADESISKDYIFEELPGSEFSWTVDKQKYTYQMTPQEYNKYISDYIKVIENARKQLGGGSLESYANAKEAAKDYMSKYKKSLKNKYLSKATKVAE